MLYVRTMRYLKPRQLLVRPLRAAQRRVPPRLAMAAIPSPTMRELASVVEQWGTADRGMERARLVLHDSFEFLNERRTLTAIDWTQRYGSHLWSYNLHYFDYAPDLVWAFRLTGDRTFLARFERLALSWIQGSGGRGDGWEPYAISVRIVNWSYGLLLAGSALDLDARDRLLRSLSAQHRALAARLEWHVQGNHLLKNLCALVVGALMFEGQARRRLSDAVQLLETQVRAQILADGHHEERSPMYHAIVLGDLLEVVALLRSVGHASADRLHRLVEPMLAALARVTRPDGSPHRINDSVDGIAPSRRALAARAQSAGMDLAAHPGTPGRWHLRDVGFAGYSSPDGRERLIIDGGVPGPDHQPAHAHCGLLGFELDFNGHQFLVDPGVHGYAGDRYREYVRSTRAHNTVAIDGREQNEMWSVFRVARRARVTRVSCGAREDQGGILFHGEYHPYHSRDVTHARTIEGGEGVWQITDTVNGQAHRATSYWHFHPAVSLKQQGDTVVAGGPSGNVRLEPFGATKVIIRSANENPPGGWFCPEFGIAQPTWVIALEGPTQSGVPFGVRLRANAGGER